MSEGPSWSRACSCMKRNLSGLALHFRLDVLCSKYRSSVGNINLSGELDHGTRNISEAVTRPCVVDRPCISSFENVLSPSPSTYYTNYTYYTLYIYIYVYACIVHMSYMHVCATCMCVCTYARVYLRTYVRTYLPTYVCRYVRTYVRACMQLYVSSILWPVGMWSVWYRIMRVSAPGSSNRRSVAQALDPSSGIITPKILRVWSVSLQ